MFFSKPKNYAWGVKKEVKKRFCQDSGKELESEVLHKVIDDTGDLVATFFEDLQACAEENASLTSAAPELKRALTNLLEFIETHGIYDRNGRSHWDDCESLREAAKAALAKAQGETK